MIIKIEKKYAYIIIGLLVLAIGVFIVNAYGTSTPSVFGHSAGEIEEADPTVLASVKDGIAWGELSEIPAGFADNIDDVGSLSCTTAETHGYYYNKFFTLASICPDGYSRTGCSLGSDASISYPFGDAEPSGNGCKCTGYSGSSMNVYCYSYCCKII